MIFTGSSRRMRDMKISPGDLSRVIEELKKGEPVLFDERPVSEMLVVSEGPWFVKTDGGNTRYRPCRKLQTGLRRIEKSHQSGSKVVFPEGVYVGELS